MFQEPAKYDFEWAVDDAYSGNDFGQQETRDGDYTSGSYYVQLPDGRLQRVDYQVNGDSGFLAEVSYEGEAEYPAPSASYQPSPVYERPTPARSYERPTTPRPSYQPPTTARSYQPPTTARSYQPPTTARSYQPPANDYRRPEPQRPQQTYQQPQRSPQTYQQPQQTYEPPQQSYQPPRQPSRSYQRPQSDAAVFPPSTIYG